MRIVVVNQQTLLVRRWFKWYRVGRSASDWRELEIKPYQKPKSIEEITEGLKRAGKNAPFTDKG